MFIKQIAFEDKTIWVFRIKNAWTQFNPSNFKDFPHPDILCKASECTPKIKELLGSEGLIIKPWVKEPLRLVPYRSAGQYTEFEKQELEDFFKEIKEYEHLPDDFLLILTSKEELKKQSETITEVSKIISRQIDKDIDAESGKYL